MTNYSPTFTHRPPLLETGWSLILSIHHLQQRSCHKSAVSHRNTSSPELLRILFHFASRISFLFTRDTSGSRESRATRPPPSPPSPTSGLASFLLFHGLALWTEASKVIRSLAPPAQTVGFCRKVVYFGHCCGRAGASASVLRTDL